MQVTQIVNSTFTSNTYVVSEENTNYVWLIDVGDIEAILNILSGDSIVKGIFLTHVHFDHIYGINKLIEKFPKCVVSTSSVGRMGLLASKLNLSFYHEDPVVFKGTNVNILKEGDKVKLFEFCFLETLETPGHNWSCLTYKIENYLFTGDSFIPGVKVVTKLKGGDRAANKKSLKKIMANITQNTIVCPGHGEMIKILKNNTL